MTSIKRYAFRDCPNLKLLYVPKSVSEIGEGAFGNTKIVRSAEEKIRIEGNYSNVNKLRNESTTYFIVNKNSLYGLTDAEGTEIVPCSLASIQQCGAGFLRFKKDNSWGIMDYQGRTIIPTDRNYTNIDYNNSTRTFSFTVNGYKGTCDSTGKELSYADTFIGNWKQEVKDGWVEYTITGDNTGECRICLVSKEEFTEGVNMTERIILTIPFTWEESAIRRLMVKYLKNKYTTDVQVDFDISDAETRNEAIKLFEDIRKREQEEMHIKFRDIVNGLNDKVNYTIQPLDMNSLVLVGEDGFSSIGIKTLKRK